MHTFRRDVQNRDFQFRYKVHVFVHCLFLSKHKVHVFCRFSKKSCTKYKYIKFDMKSNFQVQEYKFFGHFLVKIVYFELKILTSSSSYSFFLKKTTKFMFYLNLVPFFGNNFGISFEEKNLDFQFRKN